MPDETGTRSRSTSDRRTFGGTAFFGILLSKGFISEGVLFEFTIVFGLTLDVGLFNALVDAVLDDAFPEGTDFRSSKSR